VELKVLATFQELTERAHGKGLLDGDDWKSLGEWREDTVAWSERHAQP
jgi:hypothetical protein